MWPCIKCGQPTSNRRPVGPGVTVPACEGRCAKQAAPMPLSKGEMTWQRQMQEREQRHVAASNALLRVRVRAMQDAHPPHAPRWVQRDPRRPERGDVLPRVSCEVCGLPPQYHDKDMTGHAASSSP